MVKNLFLVVLAVVLLAGCAKNPKNNKHHIYGVKQKSLKPHKIRYKTTVGSRHKDSRVVINNGVVLKALVNTYKIGRHTLVPMHDMYVRVEQPDFIPEYATPPMYKRNSGLLSGNNNKVPFMLSNKEVDRSSIETNEGINKYLKSVNEKKNKQNETKRLDESKEFDSTIQKYLEEKYLK